MLLSSQALFLMKLAGVAISSLAMLTAYFAIGRKTYFLHWWLYLTLIGAALLFPESAGDRVFLEILRNLLLLLSISSFLVGGQMFRGGDYSRSAGLTLLVYSLAYAGSFTVMYTVPGLRQYHEGITSLFMALGHGLSAWFLSHPVTGRKSIAEKFALTVNDIVMLGWTGRGILIFLGKDSAHPEMLVGGMIPIMLFALIIFSQERTWQQKMSFESALERTALLSTSSTVYSTLVRKMKSPLGNANLALSHIEHEEDRDRKTELAASALKNIEVALSDLTRYEKISGSSGFHEGVLADMDRLLATVVEVTKHDERSGGPEVRLEENTDSRSYPERLIHLRQDILFHGILNILANSAPGESGGSDNIILSTRPDAGASGERLAIHIRGMDLPGDLLDINRRDMDSLPHKEAIRLSSVRSALLTIAAHMDTRITINEKNRELVISLGKQPE